jgi:hypothetical protein
LRAFFGFAGAVTAAAGLGTVRVSSAILLPIESLDA